MERKQWNIKNPHKRKEWLERVSDIFPICLTTFGSWINYPHKPERYFFVNDRDGEQHPVEAELVPEHPKTIILNDCSNERKRPFSLYTQFLPGAPLGDRLSEDEVDNVIGFGRYLLFKARDHNERVAWREACLRVGQDMLITYRRGIEGAVNAYVFENDLQTIRTIGCVDREIEEKINPCILAVSYASIPKKEFARLKEMEKVMRRRGY
ncbi:MAG: hypothetical protein AABX11_04450 [Nanoarchaeota archaeon]